MIIAIKKVTIVLECSACNAVQKTKLEKWSGYTGLCLECDESENFLIPTHIEFNDKKPTMKLVKHKKVIP